MCIHRPNTRLNLEKVVLEARSLNCEDLESRARNEGLTESTQIEAQVQEWEADWQTKSR
jgi:hypothetical protein